MKIDGKFVDEANAKLQDLKVEASIVQSLEELKEVRGYTSVGDTLDEHLAMLSNKFGKKLEDLEDVVVAVKEFEQQLGILVQVDHLADKFAPHSSNEQVMREMFESIKNKYLDKAIQVLEMELGE